MHTGRFFVEVMWANSFGGQRYAVPKEIDSGAVSTTTTTVTAPVQATTTSTTTAADLGAGPTNARLPSTEAPNTLDPNFQTTVLPSLVYVSQGH